MQEDGRAHARGRADGRDERTTLVGIMAWMATGDEAAAVALFEAFGGPIRSAVRRTALAQGARLDDDEVHQLAAEFCLELVPRAPSWDPGGASPWRWAARLITSLVAREVGQYGVPFDPDHHDRPPAPAAWSGPEGPARHHLRALAADPGAPVAPLLALLDTALGRVASDRDAELFLCHALQREQGDPSPSHTLGAEWGLRPAAVRKAVSRVRHRLVSLARSEAPFAPLLQVGVVGAASSSDGRAA